MQCGWDGEGARDVTKVLCESDSNVFSHLCHTAPSTYSKSNLGLHREIRDSAPLMSVLDKPIILSGDSVYGMCGNVPSLLSRLLGVRCIALS